MNTYKEQISCKIRKRSVAEQGCSPDRVISAYTRFD